MKNSVAYIKKEACMRKVVYFHWLPVISQENNIKWHNFLLKSNFFISWKSLGITRPCNTKESTRIYMHSPYPDILNGPVNVFSLLRNTFGICFINTSVYCMNLQLFYSWHKFIPTFISPSCRLSNVF